MTLDYIYPENASPLITEFYYLKFDCEDIPFQSTILPIGHSTITCPFGNNHKFSLNKTNVTLNDLILTGQFDESYQFFIDRKGHSFGISLHPTALHKLTSIDASIIKNSHVPLEELSDDFYNILSPIFSAYEDDISLLAQKLNDKIQLLPVVCNPLTAKIDKAIELIQCKEGLLNTYELLNHLDLSQKSLETHFKKMVGLTPGKYIRLFRFLNLMRKYEQKSIGINDLIYMYNYYDHSHFTKDFKHFMKQSPRDYFNEDHPLLNKYLSK